MRLPPAAARAGTTRDLVHDGSHAGWSEETARRVLEEQRQSGLTVAAFAARLGVSAWRLYRWRRRIEGQGGAEAPATSGFTFVPVRLAGPRKEGQQPPAFALTLPSGHTVCVPAEFDAEALVRLLRAIAEATAC